MTGIARVNATGVLFPFISILHDDIAYHWDYRLYEMSLCSVFKHACYSSKIIS